LSFLLLCTFSQFGNITFQRVCTDRESGQSRGFGFVSFDSEDNANKAVAEMDGKELDGRNIKVNIAMPREPKGGKGEGGAGGEWSPRPQGVCFAFQKGQCDRGDACRFSHTEAKEGDAAASSWSKPPCFAFQKGECWRGDDCRFSHEAEGEKKEEKAEEEVDEKKRKFDGSDSDAEDDKKDDSDDEKSEEEEEKPKKKKKAKKADSDDEETPKKKSKKDKTKKSDKKKKKKSKE
jgi:RNA-binding motif X-linked protein 2